MDEVLLEIVLLEIFLSYLFILQSSENSLFFVWINDWNPPRFAISASISTLARTVSPNTVQLRVKRSLGCEKREPLVGDSGITPINSFR